MAITGRWGGVVAPFVALSTAGAGGSSLRDGGCGGEGACSGPRHPPSARAIESAARELMVRSGSRRRSASSVTVLRCWAVATLVHFTRLGVELGVHRFAR